MITIYPNIFFLSSCKEFRREDTFHQNLHYLNLSEAVLHHVAGTLKATISNFGKFLSLFYPVGQNMKYIISKDIEVGDILII